MQCSPNVVANAITVPLKIEGMSTNVRTTWSKCVRSKLAEERRQDKAHRSREHALKLANSKIKSRNKHLKQVKTLRKTMIDMCKKPSASDPGVKEEFFQLAELVHQLRTELESPTPQEERSERAASGYKGVKSYACNRVNVKWKAYVNEDGRQQVHIGTFATVLEAARARRDYLAQIKDEENEEPKAEEDVLVVEDPEKEDVLVVEDPEKEDETDEDEEAVLPGDELLEVPNGVVVE